MITANLPARDFDETERFYAQLGFERIYRSDDWMILSRQGMQVEFFRHPDLKPEDSWFSACLRLPEIDALHRDWSSLDLPKEGIPRLTDPFCLTGAPRMFALVDPNGSLWRVMEHADGR